MTQPAAPTSPDGHPVPDVLHDLAALDRDEWAAEPVLAEPARHVGGCDQCRDYLADLDAVAVLLRSPALDPGPVPVDVADRLAAALAAERPTQSAPAATAPAVVTSLDHRRARRTRWRAGLLAAAAVAGVAVLVPASGLLSGSGNDESTAGGAASDASTESSEPSGERAQDDAMLTYGSAAAAARDLVAATRQGIPAPEAASPSSPLDTDAADGGATPGSAECGQPLAADVGARMVATTAFGAEVLVVVEAPGGPLEYLVVPTCASREADVLSRGPVPE